MGGFGAGSFWGPKRWILPEKSFDCDLRGDTLAPGQSLIEIACLEDRPNRTRSAHTRIGRE